MSNSSKDSPFTVINDINSKKYDAGNPAFSGYLANLYYSNHKETLLLANEANKYNIDPYLHYDYFFYGIKKKKFYFK
jgi:hypothetical protein